MHNSQCTIVVSLRDIFKNFFALNGGLKRTAFALQMPTSDLSVISRCALHLLRKCFVRPANKRQLRYQPFSLPISLLWWAEEDSNLRPLGYQPSALTS